MQTSSSIFDGIRAPRIEGGLSDEQLGTIVGYVRRSPIFTRRLREFEEAGGRIEFETSRMNYFWVNEGVPTVYVSPEYRNGDAEPDMTVLTKVVAHELSHFETYFRNNDGFNPNELGDADSAGAAGVRDEARAYALEYLIESEINATQPRVKWMEKGQGPAARRGIAKFAGDRTDEVARLDAATRGLLDWAANWTGPTIEAGGYFQFYKNDWISKHPPGDRVEITKVAIRCDDAGRICEIRYEDKAAGRIALVLDGDAGGVRTRNA